MPSPKVLLAAAIILAFPCAISQPASAQSSGCIRTWEEYRYHPAGVINEASNTIVFYFRNECDVDVMVEIENRGTNWRGSVVSGGLVETVRLSPQERVSRGCNSTTNCVSYSVRSSRRVAAQPARPVQPAPPALLPVPRPAPAAAPPRIDPFLLPQSGARLLTAQDLAPLSREQLWLARNEIYARRGRTFDHTDLRRYFGRQSWYRPQYDDVTLTSIEQANVDRIRQEERSRPW